MKMFCKRTYTTKIASLKGRNFVRPRDYTKQDIISVLQTALYLKSPKTRVDLKEIKNKTVTYITDQPCFKSQLALKQATQFLNMRLNTIIDQGLPQKWPFLSDAGTILSGSSDCVVKKIDRFLKCVSLTAGLTKPSFCLQTCKYSTLQVLADMLTVLESYGKFEGLNLSFFGVTGPLINTYLCIATRLGVNVRFTCLCSSGSQSPLELKNAQTECFKTKTVVKECSSLFEATEKADIITTHKHTIPRLTITKDMTKNANKGWILLHPLPRSVVEVTEEIFASPQNMTWTSVRNQKWICAALLVKLLVDFEHDLPMPDL